MRNQEALKQQGDVIWNIANLLRGPYEISFQRDFYEDKPPRPLADIEKDIANLERDIVALLKEVTA
jgi:type I restriction enzyme M protein